ncbi:Calcium binding motif EF-hand protein [Carpediemonas membranifera]|uniref:Calcium binding motif EF-hand protein n=1 Tax=Carpediemonas membranifera TaxID=201153 RepID=A0A8J6BWS6_9EUKA|nr:Calcium binding motif EF-hand protein [Carpediemonas membranifera]|eukprot:KAG9392736.1 Calcium binding motif EF-hand protein [Carpediemonas membranifera]
MVFSAVLNHVELERAKNAFDSFDKEGTGRVNIWDLRAILEAIGQPPTDEELISLTGEVEADDDGLLPFDEFIKLLEKKKQTSSRTAEDTDTIEAWVALGGKVDKTGKISIERFQELIDSYEMSLNVEAILVSKIEARMRATLISTGTPRQIVAPREIEYDTYADLCSMEERLYGAPSKS